MQILNLRSPASIWRFVEALKKKGLIASTERAWRNVELKDIAQQNVHPQSEATIPIIGAVSKGKVPELYPEAEKWPISSKLLPEGGHYYALRIKDSSFLNEFLLPEDIVVVEATQEVAPGELVLASTKETIIGHFFDEGEIIRFRSNPYSQPTQVKVSAEEVQVWGVIVYVFRGYRSGS